LKIDPVILGGFQSFHPMDWKKLDWSSKHARIFQTDAIAHGVGNQGLSIPLREPRGQYALFTVSHNCTDDVWAKFIESRRRDLILISHYFNKKALELEPEKIADVASALSPRELETLTLLALGYNRALVGQTLSISEHTVRVYVESARFKLGSMNTTHAVACALSRVLIVI
jgi:DNA-binding CsgD family transcriptional regulator